MIDQLHNEDARPARVSTFQQGIFAVCPNNDCQAAVERVDKMIAALPPNICA
jgi:hypothetical protein